MTKAEHAAFSSTQEQGLSKREYFAACALQGLASVSPTNNKVSNTEFIAALTTQAVKLADSLIERLNERTSA